MGHTEHYYQMQKWINESYRRLEENQRKWDKMLERMQRGEWGEEEEYQSSNHYGKGDYHGNRW